MPSSRRPSSRRPSSRRRDERPVSSGVDAPRTTPVVTERAAVRSAPRFTVQAVVLLAVALMILMSYGVTVKAWWSQRQEIQVLEQRIAATKTEISELEDIEKRWSDPAYVRQQARERFGWVMPGEVGYRVIGLDGRVQGQNSRLDEPPKEVPTTWTGRMWGSIEESGRIASGEETGTNGDPVLKSKKDR